MERTIAELRQKIADTNRETEPNTYESLMIALAHALTNGRTFGGAGKTCKVYEEGPTRFRVESWGHRKCGSGLEFWRTTVYRESAMKVLKYLDKFHYSTEEEIDG